MSRGCTSKARNMDGESSSCGDAHGFYTFKMPPRPITDHLTRHSLESDLNALQFVYSRCIDTASLPPPAQSRSQAGVGMAYAQVTRTDHGYALVHTSTNTQNQERCFPCYFLPPLSSRANDLSGLRLGYGKFRTDYDPILVRTRGPNDARTRTATADPDNPEARHGMSATVPATIVACCMNDAEDLDGLLGALDSYRVDGVGGARRITPKAGADSLPGADNAETQNLTGAAETKTRNTEFPAAGRRQQHPDRNRDEPERTPDSTIRIAPTAHGAAHLLEAEQLDAARRAEY
ncbi:hypothetical protein EDB85DRAFT_1888414 [Lactarius pseudohatsudake]|nr:hypothetical protein EDB85DRAFT_1888414 [Lactarius pseudohatsudake]